MAPLRRRFTTTILGPPKVVNAPTSYWAQGPMVQLAPSPRQARRAHPVPPFPIVVLAPPLAPPLRATLTRIRPPGRLCRLGAPVVVVAASPEASARPLDITLAYSRRGRAKSRLPQVLGAAQIVPLALPLVLALASSPRQARRAHPVPPFPIVVFAPPLAPSIRTPLVRIRPPGRLCRLGAPVVIQSAAVAPTFSGPVVHLAQSRRGRAKSRLPQVLVAGQIVVPLAPPLALTLARVRPRPVYAVLRGPVLTNVRPQVQRLTVWLAYSRRGLSESKLAPPILAPVSARPTLVSLAQSQRPRANSLLRPPAAAAFVAAPIRVSLVPQRRGQPKSMLRPPLPPAPVAVLREAIFQIARIRPARTIWRLSPPLPRIAYPGIQVTLVRIRPPATRYFYLRTRVNAIPICYGTVVGFDFAPEACGDDLSATVSGSTEAAEVCGSDSAATVTGASASGGSVSGGDEQREGC